MAPYAAVAANKPRSWHGTLVMAQLSQPKSKDAIEDMSSKPDDNFPPNLPDISKESTVLDKRPSVRKRLPVFSLQSEEVRSKSYLQPPLNKRTGSSKWAPWAKKNIDKGSVKWATGVGLGYPFNHMYVFLLFPLQVYGSWWRPT